MVQSPNRIDHDTRIYSLKSITHFQNLTKDQLLGISKIAEIKSYQNNELVFSQDEIPSRFTFVNNGLVKLIRTLKTGQEMILRLVTEGDGFGSIAIFAERPYLARAKCEGDATIVEIPVSRFFIYMEQNPIVLRNYLKLNAMKTQNVVRKVPEMALNRIESRVVKILLNLTEKIGYEEDGVYQLTLPLTRKELGTMAGTTTETVVRVLSKLGKLNCLDINKNHIKLSDLDYLHSLVDEFDWIGG